MSYDLTIRGDHGLDRSQINAQLAEFGLIADSDSHFLLKKSGKQYADMDVAWEGRDKQGASSEAVNCIQVHVPYAHVDSYLNEIVALCTRIANALKWRVFDEQEGRYL